MNKLRQGALLQSIVMELVERYLSRQDLPINLRVERLHDHALLVTHSTEVSVRIRVDDVVTPEQVLAWLARPPLGPPPDTVNPEPGA